MPRAPARGIIVPVGKILDSAGIPFTTENPPEAPPFDEWLRGIETGPVDRDRGYPSQRLTGAKIKRILEDADRGEPAEWVELCEEIVEKDPKVANLLSTRKGAVMGLQRYVAPAPLDDSRASERGKAEEIAHFCQVALDQSNFADCLRNQLTSVGFPLAVDWIVWALREERVVPKRFMRVPPRHVRWDSKTDQLRIVDVNDPRVFSYGGELGDLIPPYTTVRSISTIRSDHPTRAGLLRTVVWYYYFKIEAWKDWAAFADRYGMPVRALFLPLDQINDPDVVAKMQFFLRTMGTDASGIFSAGSELKLVEGSAMRGTSVYQELIEHVNKEVAGLILGHELSSQSAPGPGQLGITAALLVKQDVLEDDCEALSAVVRRDVLTPLTGWNFGWDAVEAGLTPFYYFDYEPKADLKSEMENVVQFAGTFPDFKFSERQMRDKFGFNLPEAGDELVPAKSVRAPQ